MSQPRPSKSLTIFILGTMTALTPFSIDMYLPAFPDIARDFGTSVAQVSLSLSGYFVGLAIGQLIYGPLLDRFGRRPPLFVGLTIYILASVLCLASRSTNALVGLRAVQAIGACGAGVASMAMVRDLFNPQESAKVFSLLMLILGASPLLAPTIGGFLATGLGWQSVFVTLAGMAVLLFALVWIKLPESHQPDLDVKLRAGPIMRGYWQILRHPGFYKYAISGAVSFSGLFVYLAGSTIIFLGTYEVSQRSYGIIFATIASGFIIASQLNVVFLKRYTLKQLLFAGYYAQVAISLGFLLASYWGWLSLYSTVAMFFLYFCCFGFTNSNSAAMALAPFGKNAGSASAMLGFLQMVIGALASSSVGVFGISHTAPVIAVMATASVSATLIVSFAGGRGEV